MTSLRRGPQRSHRALILLFAMLSFGSAASARDVWVVRTLTFMPGPCPATAWRDNLIFYNTTTVDQRVTPLGASNGYQIPQGQDLVVPAQRSRSVVHQANYSGGVLNAWTPAAMGQPILLVNKLDVPTGVLIESRMEIYGIGGAEEPCPLGPGVIGGLEVVGHFGFPVIERLAPPNTPLYHLGADLGTLTSRTNVGVYNAEDISATATIEVRAACDDRLLETRTVTVPGNSLVYSQGFRNTFLGTTCFGLPASPNYSRYVLVTLDRAGFSFIAARAETLPARVTVGSTTPR